MTIINALTVDVEDYFHVSAFADQIRRSDWGHYPLRVVDNTLSVLDLFDTFQVKATFFILGWVAKRVPSLVAEIVRRNHEVACHGYNHELVYQIGPERFRSDVRRAKALLEEISGQPVAGYRAPSYSITKQSLWALDILIEEGFSYDSSIFPIRHDLCGIPDAPRHPYMIHRPSGSIREFPLTTLPFKLLGVDFRLPIAGGGYLRLLPIRIILKGFTAVNTRECQPGILYFHPWEIDPGQPRIAASWKSRFRHYNNLDKTINKLQHLLGKLSFAPAGTVLDKYAEEHA